MNTLKIIADFPGFSVVEKPSGLLSVPGRGPRKRDSIAHRFKNRFPHAIQQPAVHRLDMATSGLMILAKTARDHRHLSLQFQNRRVEKIYEALLDGIPVKDGGTIELPFRLDPDNRPRQIYDEKYGKWGITRWRKISVENEAARVEMYPETGRTHQLRLHAAHPRGLGIPIVGDFLYGSGCNTHSLKLHAKYLRFEDPRSSRMLSFEVSVPF
ncbi:MAG: RluA family pseudouridine synthase [Fibrobacterota bacterium]